MKNGMFIHINWWFWTINSILSMILSSIICFTIWFHDMMIWDILGIVFHDRFQIFLCVPVKMGRFGIGPSWESSTFSGYPLPQLPHGHKDHCQPWIKQSQWNINHWSSATFDNLILILTCCQLTSEKIKKKKNLTGDFRRGHLHRPQFVGKMLPSCMGLRDHQIGFSHSGKGVVLKKMYDIHFKIHCTKQKFGIWNWPLYKTTVPLAVLLLKILYSKPIPSLHLARKIQGTSTSVGCHKPRRRGENIRAANRFAPSTRPPVTQVGLWQEMYLGTPFFETQLNKWRGGGGLWMMEKSWKIGLKSSLYNQLSSLKTFAPPCHRFLVVQWQSHSISWPSRSKKVLRGVIKLLGHEHPFVVGFFTIYLFLESK